MSCNDPQSSSLWSEACCGHTPVAYVASSSSDPALSVFYWDLNSMMRITVLIILVHSQLPFLPPTPTPPTTPHPPRPTLSIKSFDLQRQYTVRQSEQPWRPRPAHKELWSSKTIYCQPIRAALMWQPTSINKLPKLFLPSVWQHIILRVIMDNNVTRPLSTCSLDSGKDICFVLNVWYMSIDIVVIYLILNICPHIHKNIKLIIPLFRSLSTDLCLFFVLAISKFYIQFHCCSDLLFYKI